MRKIESLVIWEICVFLSSVQVFDTMKEFFIDCFFFNDVRLCNEDFVCLQQLEKFCDFQFFFHEINQGMSDVFMSVVRILENIFIITNVKCRQLYTTLALFHTRTTEPLSAPRQQPKDT